MSSLSVANSIPFYLVLKELTPNGNWFDTESYRIPDSSLWNIYMEIFRFFLLTKRLWSNYKF